MTILCLLEFSLLVLRLSINGLDIWVQSPVSTSVNTSSQEGSGLYQPGIDQEIIDHRSGGILVQPEMKKLQHQTGLRYKKEVPNGGKGAVGSKVPNARTI